MSHEGRLQTIRAIGNLFEKLMTEVVELDLKIADELAKELPDEVQLEKYRRRLGIVQVKCDLAERALLGKTVEN